MTSILPFILVTQLTAPSLDPPLDVAVEAILARNCARCHGPESDKPRAVRAWPDATDLAATAANPELVVPGAPDESLLLSVVEDGEMPPPDSGLAPVTEADRAALRAWIAAGAAVPVGGGPSEAAASEPQRPVGLPEQAARWIGRFHPIIVHFPIALLSVAPLAELLARVLRRPGLRGTATYCAALGAAAALPAALLGWLLAGQATHDADTLALHRWLGVGTAFAALAGLALMHRRPIWRLPVLLALAALVGVTGHLGGQLTFGPDWLEWR